MATQTQTQTQDADRETDVRRAMKAASERVTRDMSETKFLQAAGKMIVQYIGGSTRGIDQLQNLRTLVAVKLNSQTNLTNLNASIRDAGWAAIKSYLEKAQPNFDTAPTEDAVKEWSQDERVCKDLREALAIGADENVLKRVRAAIKKLGN